MLASLLLLVPLPSTAQAPTVQTDPTAAPVGALVKVGATGLVQHPGDRACRVEFERTPGNYVVVVPGKDCQVNGNGIMIEEFTVPANSSPGKRPARIRICNWCDEGDLEDVLTAPFEVTVEPSPTPSPTPPPSPTPAPTTSESENEPSNPEPTATTTSPDSPKPSRPDQPTTPAETDGPAESPTQLLEPPLGGPSLIPIDPDIARRIRLLPPLFRLDRFNVPWPFQQCAAPPDATLIGFDDLEPWTEVTNQYPGVTFSSAGRLATQTTDDDVGTASPPHALSNLAGGGLRLPDRFGREGPLAWGEVDGDIAMRFDEPQTEVGLYVGLPTEAAELLAVAPRGRRDPVKVTATLELINGEGIVVGSSSLVMGPDPTPVNRCLHARQRDAEVAEVLVARVSFDPPIHETIDDVWFHRDRPLPDAPPRALLDITWPREGAVFNADDEIVVSGEILHSQPIRSLRVHWACFTGTSSLFGEGRVHMYPDPGDPLRTTFVSRFTNAGSPQCPGNVAFHADVIFPDSSYLNDFVRTTILYPEVVGATPRVRPRAMELTQGVRTGLLTGWSGDFSFVTDPMTHIARRGAALRVYPELDGTFTGDTPARVYGQLRVIPSGSIHPLAAIAPENVVVMDNDVPTLDEQRRDPSLSLNFPLEPEWLREGEMRFQLRLWPLGISPTVHHVCEGCPPTVTAELRATFQPGGRILLHWINVRLEQDDDGKGIDLAPPTLTDYGAVVDQMRQYLPLPDNSVRLRSWNNVTWRGVAQEDVDGNTRYHLVDEMRRRFLVPRGIVGADPSYRGLVWAVMTSDGPFPDGLRRCGGTGWLDGAIFNSAACSWATVPTHEMSHTLGLSHSSNNHGEAGGGGFNPAYPGVCGQISYDASGGLSTDTFGVDARTRPITVFVPDVNPTLTSGEGGSCADAHVHDFLSYGWGTNWISPYVWEETAERLGGPRVTVASAQPPRALGAARPHAAALAMAQAPPDGGQVALGVRLVGDQAELLEPIAVDLPATGEGQGPIEVRALDDGGNVVATRRATPGALEGGETGGAVFVILPASGWKELVVLRDGVEVGRFSDGTAPVIEAVEVGDGSWTTDSPLHVVVTASDATSELLTATVEVSADGEDWVVVATTTGSPGELALEVERASAAVPAGSVLVRAQVSDGLHAAVGEPIEVEVGDALPIAAILDPTGQDPVRPSSALVLRGEGWSIDGSDVPPERLQWLVDGEVVGHGPLLEIGPLEPGEHVVELRVGNRAGEAASDSRTILVAEDQDRDGLPDDWETAHGLDPTDPTDATSDADHDHLVARDEWRHGGDPNDPDTDGDGWDDGTEAYAGGLVDDADVGPGGAHGQEGFLDRGRSWMMWLRMGLGAFGLAAIGAWLVLRRRAASPAVA